MFENELKFCMKVEYDEKYKGRRHAHPCWELVLYLDGKGSTRIGTKEYKFKKGDYSIIPPDDPHTEKGEAGTKVLYIGFDIINSEKSLPVGVYADKKGEVQEYMYKIWQEMQVQKEFSAVLMNLFTSVIIIKVFENIKIPKSRDSGLEYAINYINLHYMDNLTAQEIADSIGYSYDYFRKLFKEQMKVSVGDYIHNVKFHNAQQMLLNTSESIKTIAYNCGYSSPSHFCMVYKKMTGKSPYSVRKSGTANKQLFREKN